MESITFFSSGEYITFLTNAVIFRASFPMRSHSRSWLQPQSAPQGKGWELIPSHVTFPISSTRTHNFQTWVIIAQFQVTKEFAFIGHKWYWNFNLRHLQFSKYLSIHTILSFSVWKSAVIFRLQKDYYCTWVLTVWHASLENSQAGHKAFKTPNRWVPRDQGWTERWDSGQWPRVSWAPWPVGQERREAQGSKETWACGLRAGMPVSRRWGPRLCRRRGRLRAVTSVDVWWRGQYEEGWLSAWSSSEVFPGWRQSGPRWLREILNKRASTGLISCPSMCSKLLLSETL